MCKRRQAGGRRRREEACDEVAKESRWSGGAKKRDWRFAAEALKSCDSFISEPSSVAFLLAQSANTTESTVPLI